MVVSSSTSFLLSFIGWAVIPDVLTTYILKALYSLSAFSSTSSLHISFLPSFPPPVRGTALYARHYRFTYAFVVLSYLLYNLIQSSLVMEYNYYEMLDVQTDVDDSGLKLAFRAWVRMNHPDKIQGRGDELQREEWFKRVREGYEALRDPVVRFAYDR
jgi:preprotein translocase subunit Sec63